MRLTGSGNLATFLIDLHDDFSYLNQLAVQSKSWCQLGKAVSVRTVHINLSPLAFLHFRSFQIVEI